MNQKWIVFIVLLGVLESCESPPPTNRQKVEKPISASTKVRQVKSLTPTEPTVEAPFLWKVSHHKGDSYLLGTIHQSVKPDEVVNEALYEKIDESRIVVFESDTKAMEENGAEAMAFSNFPEGTSLKAMLGKEYWAVLKTLVDLPEPVLDRFKPWLLMTLITLEKLRDLDMFLVRGMDDTLRRYAELQSRKIGFLEGWRQVLADVDSGMTIQYLREMIDDKERIGTEFLALRSSYMSGDEEELLKQFKIESESDKNFMDVIIFGRNEKWIKPLIGFLNDGNAFILMGVGHLVGEKSVITLLKGRGFKVERVKSVSN